MLKGGKGSRSKGQGHPYQAFHFLAKVAEEQVAQKSPDVNDEDAAEKGDQRRHEEGVPVTLARAVRIEAGVFNFDMILAHVEVESWRVVAILASDLMHEVNYADRDL